MALQAQNQKNVALEAARGIASIVVVLHHFFLAFAPKYTGFLEVDRTAKSVAGDWYFALFNGNGAVYFFFVLSGFVLSRSYLSSRDPGALVVGALKRLPRLALPVTLSLCLAVLLIKLGAYSYATAAQVTGSTWLQTAGFSNTPTVESASFLDAIRQGLVTYFNGEISYNSNIWTMKPEFTGSLLVFSILPMLAYPRSPWILAGLAALLVAVGAFTYAFAVPFVLGATLSVFLDRRSTILPAIVSVAMICGGLYLLGYVASIESYEWLRLVDPLFGGGDTSLAYNSVGAMLVISALVGSPGLSKGLSGRAGDVLGKLSFPMYLSHFPILMSLSGTVLLWALHSGAKGWVALHITLAATFLAVLLVSIPLAVIDVQWVRFLNRAARRLNVEKNSERALEQGITSAGA